MSPSKKLHEPLSKAHFEALEQTCRLRPLEGSGVKYILYQFPAAQVHCQYYTKFSLQKRHQRYGSWRGFKQIRAHVTAPCAAQMQAVPNGHHVWLSLRCQACEGQASVVVLLEEQADLSASGQSHATVRAAPGVHVDRRLPRLRVVSAHVQGHVGPAARVGVAVKDRAPGRALAGGIADHLG